jgi:8-oxo-dGTP pyrophosphatase MutT (NUDIX family)
MRDEPANYQPDWQTTQPGTEQHPTSIRSRRLMRRTQNPSQVEGPEPNVIVQAASEIVDRARLVDLRDFVPFKVLSHTVGWIRKARIPLLLQWRDTFTLCSSEMRMPRAELGYSVRSELLRHAICGLAQMGHVPGWRNENYGLLPQFGLPAIAEYERSAVYLLGARALSVHLTLYTRRNQELCTWVARRSLSKSVDPGKYDSTVCGGVPAGSTILATLQREAHEEATLHGELLCGAKKRSILQSAFLQNGGLHIGEAHCYELESPSNFRPRPQDGEVDSFELMSASQIFALCANPDIVCTDSALCLLDFLLSREALPNLPEHQRRQIIQRLRTPISGEIGYD